MANERLRTALLDAGMEPEDLAAATEVDIKTVRRWLSGRTPRARYRYRVVKALSGRLDVDEHDLWPDVAATAAEAGDDRRDLTAIFAESDDARAPSWHALLQGARHRIDLLDTTLADVLTTPGVPGLLGRKATEGAQVTILIAHPKSIWVQSVAQQLGQDEPDDEGMTPVDHELYRVRGQLEPLLGQAGIDIRACWAERANAILRFDDEMLVTLHLYATPGSQAPLLHLHRRDDDGLFERFAAHLDAIRDQASEPLEPTPAAFSPTEPDPAEPAPATVPSFQTAGRPAAPSS